MSTTIRPVGIVTPADVATIPEPVTACASCGYLGIRPATLREGALPGASALMTSRVCPRCGHQGPPLEFDTRADYVAFIAALHEFPSTRD